MRFNFLRELPLEVSRLERLCVLHLDENELRELAPWVRMLTALADLSLAQNQLEHLDSMLLSHLSECRGDYVKAVGPCLCWRSLGGDGGPRAVGRKACLSPCYH